MVALYLHAPFSQGTLLKPFVHCQALWNFSGFSWTMVDRVSSLDIVFLYGKRNPSNMLRSMAFQETTKYLPKPTKKKTTTTFYSKKRERAQATLGFIVNPVVIFPPLPRH